MGSWGRQYTYGSNNATNQLLETKLSGYTKINYTYDHHGNMKGLPHLKSLEWNHQDELVRVKLDASGNVAHYTYDGGGQRTRKIITNNGLKQKERLYLGLVERYQEYDNNGVVTLERWTLQVEGLAQVDTLTVYHAIGLSSPTPVARYQYRDRLGSSTIEANELGQVISYEEYYPYGASAYRAAASGVDLNLKRYRFTGKERDEETGLDYFGVRYYAAWLGRWTSGDPGGFVDGLNLYRYARNNPVNGIDREGCSTEQIQDYADPPEKGKPKVVDNKIVGYYVGKGQGYTHIADHINDPETQKQYGYELSEPVEWNEIAFQVENFAEYLSVEFEQKNITYEEAWDPMHKAWTSLNMNEGDFLIIEDPNAEQIEDSKSIVKGLERRYLSVDYTTIVLGSTGSVGGGLGEVGGEINSFTVPKKFPGWHSGLEVTFGGISLAATNGIGIGGSVSAGGGILNINTTRNDSDIEEILSRPASAFAIGIAEGFGGKCIRVVADDGSFEFIQLHVMLGGGIDLSTTHSNAAIMSEVRVQSFDSIPKWNREFEEVGLNNMTDEMREWGKARGLDKLNRRRIISTK